MKTLFLKFVLSCISLFTTLNVLAGAVGLAQPAHPGLAGFLQDCAGRSSPCWYGIVPGQTRITEAARLLYAHGYISESVSRDRLARSIVSYTARDGAPIQRINLAYNDTPVVDWILLIGGPLRFGDLAALFGPPDGVIFPTASGFSVSLVFQQRVSAIGAGGIGWSSFEDAVGLVIMAADPPDQVYSPLFAWHGRVPRWRYCQLEPDALGCLRRPR